MNSRHIISTIFGLGIAAYVNAQTYHHDKSVMEQFLVGETGAGSLYPDLYYDTFHKSYRNSAMSSSKMVFRGQMNLVLIDEILSAEKIDSALTKRKDIELLNIADRTPSAVDPAWLAEGPKIQTKLNLFQEYIDRIIPSGGTQRDKDYFVSKYNCIMTGLDEVRDAYMPLSSRKKEYIAVYKDVVAQINEIHKLLLYRTSQKSVKSLQQSKNLRKASIQEVASEAKGRWKVALVQGSVKK